MNFFSLRCACQHRSIKPCVDSVGQKGMFAEESWVFYRVLDVSDRVLFLTGIYG